LSGRGLCDELITRPEESYRLYCVVVCDLETSRMGAPYIYDISHLRVKGPLIMAQVTLLIHTEQLIAIFGEIYETGICNMKMAPAKSFKVRHIIMEPHTSHLYE